MAQFPAGLPAFSTFDPTATLAVSNHAARHNTVHDEIVAVATKVGINSSTDANSHDKKITDLRTDVNLRSTIAYVDAAIATARQQAYPIGSIYFNAGVATNPGTLLGFGTWAAWGSGRVPVGVDSTQTEFDVLEETGGAKTHTLTTTEMPAHTHTTTFAHLNDFNGPSNVIALASGDDSAGNDVYTSSSMGGNGAHNNLQPYITVHMWKRTA